MIYSANKIYPWYDDLTPIHVDYSESLEKMKKFEESSINPDDKILFLIWNMPRYNPEDRWSAIQVLDYLYDYRKEMTEG